MKYSVFIALALTLMGCKENYSNGEKVGNLIEFTSKGVFWDSWEGRLNLTQTGMNTSGSLSVFPSTTTAMTRTLWLAS